MDRSIERIRVTAADGAAAELQVVAPQSPPTEVLLWLPAMGVAARHYESFALAVGGSCTAVAVHEWRGNGSSDRRAARGSDWGYRELLELDLPASLATLRERFPTARLWLGGHSLGGQLSALFAALCPAEFEGLLLIASGAPYWRCFQWRWPLRGLLWTAPRMGAVCGYFPGRRVGFGGNEAVRLIRDWSRSGLSGDYRFADIRVDLEAALARVRLPVLALQLEDDWLAPPASLDWLRRKMGCCDWTCQRFGASELDDATADHFTWMKRPRRLAHVLTAFVESSRKPLKR